MSTTRLLPREDSPRAAKRDSLCPTASLCQQRAAKQAKSRVFSKNLRRRKWKMWVNCSTTRASWQKHHKMSNFKTSLNKIISRLWKREQKFKGWSIKIESRAAWWGLRQVKLSSIMQMILSVIKRKSPCTNQRRSKSWRGSVTRYQVSTSLPRMASCLSRGSTLHSSYKALRETSTAQARHHWLQEPQLSQAVVRQSSRKWSPSFIAATHTSRACQSSAWTSPVSI